MADHVLEIPLPGRKFCGSTADGAPPAAPLAVPAFVAGPENHLLAGAVNRWLPSSQKNNLETDGGLPVSLPPVIAIHGPSGTGKTHLVRGLVGAWREQHGAESAEYFTATDFRHTLVEAIKQESVDEFRSRVRGRELLAIDNLDRLPNDDYLQQELRYTIDDIADCGGLLVVASSRAVSSLRNLPLDVRSRLSAGLMLPASPPDLAARKRLIVLVSALLGQPLSEAATDRLAAAITGTANDVFGALVELDMQAAEHRGPDNVARVERCLARRRARRPTMRVILQRVARYYRLPQYALKSSSRKQSIVFARAMVIYLAREIGGLSYERIGHALGGRDHTTIMHSYRKIADQLIGDAATSAALDELRNLLKVP